MFDREEEDRETHLRQDGGEESPCLRSYADDCCDDLVVLLVNDTIDVRFVGQSTCFVRSPEELVTL